LEILYLATPAPFERFQNINKIIEYLGGYLSRFNVKYPQRIEEYCRLKKERNQPFELDELKEIILSTSFSKK